MAAALAVAGVSALATPAHAQVLLTETFTGASTPAGAWIAPSPKGTHTPCLTAAAVKPPAGSLGWCSAVRDGTGKPDQEGKGAFQITDNSLNDAGGLILNQNLDARKGLHIEFDLFQYNATSPKGADGVSFFLIDGDVAKPNVGEPGGSLGYYKIDGAVVGVGFDEYGNFSSKGSFAAKDKGPGKVPNSVVVRGSQSTEYQYVKGVVLDPATQALAVDGVRKRDQARRTVNIDVSTAGIMNVYLNFYDDKGLQKILKDVNLNRIPGQAELPDKIKLGFSASTGQYNGYHELQNFKVSTLDPDLITTVKAVDAPWQAGGTGNFEITVANKGGAGPTSGPVTTSFTVPDGLKPVSATGTGWTCRTEGQKVSCTHSGLLEPGESKPPIKVKVALDKAAPPQVELQATAETPNEHKPADNVSPPLTVDIKPAPVKAPDLSVTTRPDGTFQAGGTGSSTTTVANATGAGPTTGPTTVTIPAPAGTTIASSSGEGWTCTVAPGAASSTCTRPDVLEPGRAFPPIATVYNVPAATKGPVSVGGGTVDTPGETNLANNTAPAAQAEVKPARKGPDLSIVLGGTGNFVPGGEGTLTATVSNAATAGPTEGPVTVAIPIPEGLTVGKTTGAGWTCAEKADAVVCTRSDVLKPGASYPPVSISVTGAAGLELPLAVTGTVDVSGDVNLVNNTALPIALPRPGLQVGMTITPNPYEPGDKLSYTITVTNTGGTAVTDADLKGYVAAVWKGVPWTCSATTGSTCPPKPGNGDITAKISVAPGGSVTFTADCKVPDSVSVPLTGSAVVTAASDANCALGCTVNTQAVAASAARLVP